MACEVYDNTGHSGSYVNNGNNNRLRPQQIKTMIGVQDQSLS